ncbi:hypothetical protein [Saccharopolyspora pogona]|uniref:hypothetical protein n=1 Tax=Saccharopolyspora pogona TaxID=333966 RepID=UPI001683AC47|nr:hypothetical protein [Saccharopolyspora pogona]
MPCTAPKFALLGRDSCAGSTGELRPFTSSRTSTSACKHLAAACYLLAESFDEDPFQILAWRGRQREELLDRLRALRGSLSAPAAEAADDAAPLPECLETFWTAPESPAASAIPAPEPTAPDALLDELDPLPVKIQGESAVELLRPAYRAMALVSVGWMAISREIDRHPGERQFLAKLRRPRGFAASTATHPRRT